MRLIFVGAPWEISKDLITTMNVGLVVHGSQQDYHSTVDPYRVAKELGIYKEIER